MFCKNCGKEVDEKAFVCVHCGCALEKKENIAVEEPKNTMGILLGLFLGLIGLIIGVCLYKDGSLERETFIKGWTKGFIISVVISVVIGIIYGCIIGSLMGSFYY